MDSYHAILAMISRGVGWSILTPLGAGGAPSVFLVAVDIVPLPMTPLTRGISLMARRQVMQDLPSQTADCLRRHLTSTIVSPIVARLPWMADQLRVVSSQTNA
jgi:hypothetical protein